jgi:hypothetical protein
MQSGSDNESVIAFDSDVFCSGDPPGPESVLPSHRYRLRARGAPGGPYLPACIQDAALIQ